ncbi:MAG: hypothetical protein HY556_01825 [Euryarchaeota archaeon]|nr:hypothetical protein [Euryarchaeota archaeon]
MGREADFVLAGSMLLIVTFLATSPGATAVGAEPGVALSVDTSPSVSEVAMDASGAYAAASYSDRPDDLSDDEFVVYSFLGQKEYCREQDNSTAEEGRTSVAFARGAAGQAGQFIVAGGPNRHVTGYSYNCVRSGTQSSALWQFDIETGGTVNGVAISDDGALIGVATTSSNNACTGIVGGFLGQATICRVWVLRNKGTVGTEAFNFTAYGHVAGVVMSGDGKWVLAGGARLVQGGSGGAVYLLDTTAIPEGSRLAGSTAVRFANNYTLPIVALAISKDGGLFAYGLTDGSFILVRNKGSAISAPDDSWQSNKKTSGGASVPVTTLALDATGSRVMVGYENGDVEFYQVAASGNFRADKTGTYKAASRVNDVVIADDGSYSFAAADKLHGFYKESATPLWSLVTGTSAPTTVATSADGLFFSAGAGTRFLGWKQVVDLTVSAVSATLSAKAGETASFEIRLVNAGSTVEVLALGTNAKAAYSPSLSQDRLTVRPGETGVVFLNVLVPAGELPGKLQFNVSASSKTVSKVVSLTLNVGATSDVELLTDTRDVGLNQGEIKTVDIVVRNTGNAADSFELSASQPPTKEGRWRITVEPRTVSVPMGDQETVALTIEAPRDGVDGEVNIVTIVAKNPSGSASWTLTVTARINPRFSGLLTANPSTVTISHGGSQVFNITAENNGNTIDNYQVNAVLTGAQADRWTATFDTPAFELNANQKKTVKLTVTAPNAAQPDDVVTIDVQLKSLGKGSIVRVLQLKAVVGAAEKQGNGLPGPEVPLLLSGVAIVAIMSVTARRRRGPD